VTHIHTRKRFWAASALSGATLLALLSLAPLSIPLQAQRSLSGEARIRLALAELQNTGSVMMIAAHPDDENTALLTYLARGRHVRTAYLSLTRGEGGQNLIGSEQGDELGIIRTQELLAARRIDGAEQYFTRAIDFGFTKTADETLKDKWPREKVLGDVVWAIRRFRPDVIILRFSGTPRDGHGQHQASAILGKEAFNLAADSNAYPEQLKYVKTWQPKRLMTNLANFGPEQEKEIEKIADKLEVDLGEYSPLLGYSYNEIAGMSRSQHRSQSMGTAERKGFLRNYFVTDKGDKATKDILEGINATWTRVEGGAPVGQWLEEAAQGFNPAHPEALVPALARIRGAIANIAKTGDPIAERKLKEVDEAIALANGVWVEALSDKFEVVPGGTAKVTLTALSRVPGEVTLLGAKLSGIDGVAQPTVATSTLALNRPSQFPVNIKIPETQAYSQPYWLRQAKEGAMYSIPDLRTLGDPENAPVLTAEFRLKVGTTEITLTRPVENRYVDRIYGELTRPLAIVPPVGVEFGGIPMVFPDTKSRRVEVPVKATVGKVAGDVHLETPAGWQVEPPTQHFELGGVDEETMVAFTLTPPAGESIGVLRPVAVVGNRSVASNVRVLNYPHFPIQTLFPGSDAKLVRQEIKTLSKNVGYVVGAGDEMPASLRQLGVDVTFLSADDLMHGDLARFDAIVTGVRAFNVRPDLRANYQRLYKYVEDGGTLVVQYNTPDGGGPGGGAAGAVPETPALAHMGPYPIKESRDNRDRVTVEEAPVVFPNPQLPVLHTPNEITAKDFEGWIQERGLNFAVEWDAKYQPVFSSQDPGEMPKLGGTLYAKYGKGAYIFTAFSWFRELPAGVPGAYRIFANFLSAGKAQ
jgi:LmbE family N-acetylglucosaminyl deacetylase